MFSFILSVRVDTSLKALAIVKLSIGTFVNINTNFTSRRVKSTFEAWIASFRACSTATSANTSVGSELVLALSIFTADMIARVAFVDVDALVSPVEFEAVAASAFIRT